MIMKYEEILPITNVLMFKKRMWLTEYAFRIKKWFEGEKQGPLRIDAEVSRRCNLNCIFCSRRAAKIDLNEESRRIEMPKERWIRIAMESGELKTKNWNISGIGEPMTRPDTTLSLMETLKSYDIFGELTTNGTLWKDKYIKRTVEMGWDSICVSIDAPTAKLHDSLRGVKGVFKKATWTVKRFSFWKKKLNSDVPSITINVVLNNKNYDKLDKMVKLTHDLGGDAVFVEPMVIFSDLAKPLQLSKKEMKELPYYIKRARDAGDKYNVLPTISCVGVERNFDSKIVEKSNSIRELLIEDSKKYNNPLLRIPCYAPWFFLMIRVDGSAVHCGEWPSVVGNLKNESLESIWFGPNLERIRKEIINGELPKSCDKCRPNVVNDMRQIRKSIQRYTNVFSLQKELIDLLEENYKLRKQLYVVSKGRRFNCEITCPYRKELIKIKHSLTYRFASKISSTRIGKKVKKVLLDLLGE